MRRFEDIGLKYRLDIAVAVTLMFLIAAFPVFVQESAISHGVAWVEENQDSSGMSRTDQEIPFRGTFTIVVALSLLNGACIT